MPRWAQSIRFRLSLAYAMAVFAGGAVLIASMYFWQARQLEEPIIVQTQQVIFEDPLTGAQSQTRFQALRESDLNAAIMEAVEQQSYRRSLVQLRQTSAIGIGLLAVFAFASGWFLSGWTLAPIRRIMSVARDISGTELSRRISLDGPDDELKEVADTFDEMLDRLQSAFEGQRRFAQDASHELRNPLAVTLTNLELALDEPDPDQVRRAVTIAHSSAGRMGTIVDELVDQARLGLATTQRSPVDLRALVSDVAADSEAAASGRGISIKISIDGDTPPDLAINGDQVALSRAVTNLVVNAVRLAPESSTITVAVDCDDRDARLTVIDEGPGISDADREKVFDRFWRGPEAGKGLGLGLSIVRQIAERHGGRAELLDGRGPGSTFRITLPRPITTGTNDRVPAGSPDDPRSTGDCPTVTQLT